MLSVGSSDSAEKYKKKIKKLFKLEKSVIKLLKKDKNYEKSARDHEDSLKKMKKKLKKSFASQPKLVNQVDPGELSISEDGKELLYRPPTNYGPSLIVPDNRPIPIPSSNSSFLYGGNGGPLYPTMFQGAQVQPVSEFNLDPSMGFPPQMLQQGQAPFVVGTRQSPLAPQFGGGKGVPTISIKKDNTEENVKKTETKLKNISDNVKKLLEAMKSA